MAHVSLCSRVSGGVRRRACCCCQASTPARPRRRCCSSCSSSAASGASVRRSSPPPGPPAGTRYYFLPPAGFWIEDFSDWVAFVTFIITAVIAGELSARAERRRQEAQAGRQEIERLYSGAAGGVRSGQRGRGGAPQRAAQGGAARRADAQPAHAADLDQSRGHRADCRRHLARRLRTAARRPAGAARGHRRGI